METEIELRRMQLRNDRDSLGSIFQTIAVVPSPGGTSMTDADMMALRLGELEVSRALVRQAAIPSPTVEPMIIGDGHLSRPQREAQHEAALKAAIESRWQW
jgi:hypothetical protein